MTFVPINEDHAVAACSFAIGLDTSFNAAALNHILSQSDTWSDLLPARAVVDMEPEESIVPLMPGVSSKAVHFANLRPDGSQVWFMRCGFNEVLVGATRYTRWQKTWDVAKSLIARVATQATDVFAQREVHVATVALQVVDKFYSDGPAAIGSALCRSEWVGDRFFSANSRYWHSHTGWFDEHATGEVLSHLNCGVAREGERDVLTLTHAQQFRLKEGSLVSLSGEKMISRVDEIMTKLHVNNKAVVKAQLSADLSKRIGLME